VTVGELCTRRVVIGRSEETAAVAAFRMRQERVGDLVVVDDARHALGIVTDRDLVLRVMAEERDPGSVMLRDVMTPGPVTVEEEADVARTLTVMKEHGVRRVPVVGRDGLLIGIITADDIVEWIAEELGDVVMGLDHARRHDGDSRLHGDRAGVARKQPDGAVFARDAGCAGAQDP
jgi:CBS domain-containing protein